jgi:hypothetical protein
MEDTPETTNARLEDRTAVAILRPGNSMRDHLKHLAEILDTEATALIEMLSLDRSILSPRPNALDAHVFETDLQKELQPPKNGFSYRFLAEPQFLDDREDDKRVYATSNVVKIPTLLNREVVLIYRGTRRIGDGLQTPRDGLRHQSFKVRREAGLRILRRVGALAP